MKAKIQKVVINEREAEKKELKMYIKNMDRKWRKNITLSCLSNLLLSIYLDFRLGKSDADGELKNKL